MMKKTVNWMGILVLTFSFPMLAQARKGGGEKKFEKMFSELNLTEEQKTKFKEIRESRKQNKDQGKGKELREKMEKALGSDASEADLKKIHEEIKAQKIQKMDSRFQHMIETRKILTPEQRKKMHELRSKKHGKKGGWFSKHRGEDDDED